MSASALGLILPPFDGLEVDKSSFQRLPVSGEAWFGYSYGVAWVDEAEQEHRYSFRVMESPQSYNQQVAKFRQTLIVWLACSSTATVACSIAGFALELESAAED